MPFCPNCGKEVSEDTNFCPKCGKRLIKTQSEQPATSALYKEVSAGELGKRMNWFERHLNWTMVLAWVGAGVIAFIVGFLAGLADPYASEDELSAIGFVIGLVVSLLVGRWVLRKKNRSM
ncbi:MAG: zinc-ribbon domain-containing protein, partial [Dehalococcoidia bacterium]|nr:zinc-ribbon domain-containing protein [Dehalococcoidia bacterium]